MSSQEVFFLSFLEDINPTAAQSAKKMQELIYEDPSSSVMKARLFAEAILSDVFKLEEIQEPYINSLYEKISYLARNGYIKREIQKSFDTIRLSGNKAAHDGQFNDITEAFKLHKEMYKIAVWFYEVYSLEQLKVPVYDIPKPRQQEKIEDIVKKQILDLFGTEGLKIAQKESISEKEESQFVEEIASPDHNDNYKPSLLNKDLEKGQSYLIRELNRLKDSSKEAIENANNFSSFKDYMHVDRNIQLDLENILERNKDREKGNLILLCGSVGDGKSHLLAYLKEKKPELIKGYKIFNDATESFSPDKDAMETLEEILNSFSDEKIEHSTQKVILAINMGVLHNFINVEHKEYSYKTLKHFIEQSDLFSQSITTYFSDENFDLLSFGDYQSYELTEKGPNSPFYSSLLKKVCNPSEENPFYLALKEDRNNEINSIVHANYKLLQNKFVQEQIIQLIIQTIVRKKLVISARAFLNLIADILIPDNIQNIELMSKFDVLEFSLPNLLFNRKERSSILQALSQLDPIHHRSIFIDQLVVELSTLNDWDTVIDNYIHEETTKGWFKPFISKDNLTDYSFNLFFETFIRSTFLTNEKFASNVADHNYLDFLKNLYYFNVGDKRKIKSFYDEIKTAIFKWKGSPKKDYIYLDKPSEKYRLAQKLELKPSISHLRPSTKEIIESFKSFITLAYNDGKQDNNIFLDIDFPLYQLLMKVQDGYCPNRKNEEDAIKFVEFIEKLMAFGDKKKEMLVHFPKDDRFYTIKRDTFDSFVFERE
ncbi:DNA phosphorothioation-dependent restriction protein DptF [Priestia aryabhattai]|uniref:DNA phosphorothioation-dependent restriction protein DptF n=1 Tax=Priestia aryabhattai TaxID=412384 RepID=UPI003D2C456C